MAARPAHGAALEHDDLARVGVTLVNLRRVRFAHGADTRAECFRHTRASILALVNVRGGGVGQGGAGRGGHAEMDVHTHVRAWAALPADPTGTPSHTWSSEPSRSYASCPYHAESLGHELRHKGQQERHLGVLGVLCLGSADGDFRGESVLYLGLSFAAGRREGRPRSLTTRGSTVSRAGWSFGSTTRPPGSPAIFHHTRHTPRHMTLPHTIIAPDNCIKGPENCA
jgi:hypothetical protein